MARRFGSAIISKADSMLCIYSIWYIRVKEYLKKNGAEGAPLLALFEKWLPRSPLVGGILSSQTTMRAAHHSRRAIGSRAE